MPEDRTRKLEQRIVDYLDTKAKNSKVTELTTKKPYASIEELARNLNSTSRQINSLIEELLGQSRIKELASIRSRKRFFGSNILPTIEKENNTPEQDVGDKRNGYRICPREITMNLTIALR